MSTRKDPIRSAELAADLSRRFDEIRAYMAKELGFGPLSVITSEQSDDLDDMADEAVASWEEAVAASGGKLQPHGELQLLLAYYSVTAELCFLIMGMEIDRANDSD